MHMDKRIARGNLVETCKIISGNYDILQCTFRVILKFHKNGTVKVV